MSQRRLTIQNKDNDMAPNKTVYVGNFATRQSVVEEVEKAGGLTGLAELVEQYSLATASTDLRRRGIVLSKTTLSRILKANGMSMKKGRDAGRRHQMRAAGQPGKRKG